MHPRPSFAIILIAISALSTGAIGQNVYKCGNSYSDQACASGEPLPLRDHVPGAAEKKAADQATARDSRLANAMEHDRLQQEKQARQQTTTLTTPASARKTKSATLAKKVTAEKGEKAKKAVSPSLKAGQAGHFVAHVPGTGSKKNVKKTTPPDASATP